MVSVEDVQRCGSIYIKGFPEGGTFGIDLRSWTCGPLFSGVKLLPPGVHLVTYDALNVPEAGKGGEGAAGSTGGGPAPSTAPLCSFFINVATAGQVDVFQFNSDTAELIDLHATDPTTAEALASGVKRMEFDRHMGAYPTEQFREWASLLRHTTFDDVCRIRPANGVHARNTSKPLTQREKDFLREGGAGDAAEAERDPHGLSAKLFFTAVPPMPAGLRGGQITSWQMDGTGRLKGILKRLGGCEGGPPVGGMSEAQRQVVAELELAFVLFFVAQNFEGFEHWKRLFDAVFTAEEALFDTEGFGAFFTAACRTAAVHLDNIPADLFAIEESFLPDVLSAFAELVERPSPIDSNADLRAAADLLVLRATSLLGNLAASDDHAEYAEQQGGDGLDEDLSSVMHRAD